MNERNTNGNAGWRGIRWWAWFAAGAAAATIVIAPIAWTLGAWGA